MGKSNSIIKIRVVYEKFGRFWLGRVKEYPEIMTQAETLKELRENMKDALCLTVFENRSEVEPKHCTSAR